jgi:hypothetical protein
MLDSRVDAAVTNANTRFMATSNIQTTVTTVRTQFSTETNVDAVAVRNRAIQIGVEVNKAHEAYIAILTRVDEDTNATTAWLDRLEARLRRALYSYIIASSQINASICPLTVVNFRASFGNNDVYLLTQNSACFSIAVNLGQIEVVKRQLILIEIARKAHMNASATARAAIVAAIARYRASQANLNTAANYTTRTAAQLITAWDNAQWKDDIRACVKALGNGALNSITSFEVTGTASVRTHALTVDIDLSIEGAATTSIAATTLAAKLQACIVLHSNGGDASYIKVQATHSKKRGTMDTVTATQVTDASAPTSTTGAAASSTGAATGTTGTNQATTATATTAAGVIVAPMLLLLLAAIIMAWF